MARYRITSWKAIPSLVEAIDGDQVARRPLSQRFQDLIDVVAMREGGSDSETYLEGWEQGPEVERPGSPQWVADVVADELEAGFDDVATARLRPRADGPA